MNHQKSNGLKHEYIFLVSRNKDISLGVWAIDFGTILFPPSNSNADQWFCAHLWLRNNRLNEIQRSQRHASCGESSKAYLSRFEDYHTKIPANQMSGDIAWEWFIQGLRPDFRDFVMTRAQPTWTQSRRPERCMKASCMLLRGPSDGVASPSHAGSRANYDTLFKSQLSLLLADRGGHLAAPSGKAARPTTWADYWPTS